MRLSKGRIPSLLAWGLLVGGVALLITFPEVDADARLFLGALPAALLFLLAGIVFGLSHPEGRDWVGAALLGWVPAVAVVASVLAGARLPPIDPWLLALGPAALAAGGAAAGAIVARHRAPGT